jgi:hypothetical protein
MGKLKEGIPSGVFKASRNFQAGVLREVHKMSDQVAFRRLSLENLSHRRSNGLSGSQNGEAFALDVIPVLGGHLGRFAHLPGFLKKHLQTSIEASIYRKGFTGIDPAKHGAVLFALPEEVHGGIENVVGGTVLTCLKFLIQEALEFGSKRYVHRMDDPA